MSSYLWFRGGSAPLAPDLDGKRISAEDTNVRTRLDVQVRARLKPSRRHAEMFAVITPHTFAVVLVFASVALAFWAAARFPGIGPTTFPVAVVVMLAGAAAARAIPGLTNAAMQLLPSAAPLLVPFAIALPLLTLTFLSGLWVLRLIHRSLSGFAG